MLSDEILTNLRSLDRAELARTLKESCLVYEGDTKLDELLAAATLGGEEDAKVLAAMIGPRKRQPGEAYRDFRTRSRLNWLAKRKPEWFEPASAVAAERPVKEYGARLPIVAQPVSLDGERSQSRDQSLWHARIDESDAALRAYLFEHWHDMWPHIVGPPPSGPPAGYRPKGESINPFRQPAAPVGPMKSSMLTGADATKIYNAMAYAMWQGVVLNVHIIIVWSMMRLSEKAGADVLGKYLNEVRKWLNAERGPRGKESWRSLLTKTQLRYVYVHENVPRRGFHSHVLIHLPPALKEEFEQWSISALRRLAGCHFNKDAFRVVRGYGCTERAQVNNAWRWYRYLMKSIDPQVGVGWLGDDGVYQARSYRDFLKPWPAKGTALDVPEGLQLAKASHNIGKDAQERDQFVSRLDQCAMDELYAGRELDEGRWYRELLERREKDQILIQSLML